MCYFSIAKAVQLIGIIFRKQKKYFHEHSFGKFKKNIYVQLDFEKKLKDSKLTSIMNSNQLSVTSKRYRLERRIIT